MKKRIPAALLLTGLGLAAQDHAVTLRYITLKPESFTTGGQSFTTDDYKGLGLRYSQTAARFWDARLEVEGTWQLRTSGSDLFLNGANVNNATTTYEMSHQSMGLGASLTWTRVVDFGAMFDVRHEDTTLRATSSTGGYLNASNAVVRPWLSARVGYTFPTDKVKPFVALEYGLPLAKKSGSDVLFGGGYDLGRKLQPKNELAFNAGLRF